MKITDLIEALEAAKKLYGDLDLIQTDSETGKVRELCFRPSLMGVVCSEERFGKMVQKYTSSDEAHEATQIEISL